MIGVVASISDKVGDVGGYLREQREHARLSVRQLATLAGVSNPYLSQVERGLRNPSAEVLSQIAKGLRISAGALYVRAGILDQEDRPDVEVAIATDPQLTDRQRRVLLDIYATFRSENERSDDDVPAESPPSRGTTKPAATKRAATRPAATTRAGKRAASTGAAASTSAASTSAAPTSTGRAAAPRTSKTAALRADEPSTARSASATARTMPSRARSSR